MPATTNTLIEAGRTLATIAAPNRDVSDFGTDLLEIAETLRLAGRGLHSAAEIADELRDGRLETLADGKLWDLEKRRLWTRDEVELAHRNEIAAVRATAARTAQKALVELARVIGELEIG